MKNLSRERLAELLLSRLGTEEYFLHHFLMFCQRYRVLVAWAVLWGLAIAADILSGEFTWVQKGMYVWLIMTLYVVLLTWVGGVFQYVMEWQCFAGGAGRRWRALVSLALSLAVAAFIWMLTSGAIWANSLRGIVTRHTVGPGFWGWPANDGIYELSMDPSHGGFVLVTFMFCAAVVVAYSLGNVVYDTATQILARRFDPDRPHPMPGAER